MVIEEMYVPAFGALLNANPTDAISSSDIAADTTTILVCLLIVLALSISYSYRYRLPEADDYPSYG